MSTETQKAITLIKEQGIYDSFIEWYFLTHLSCMGNASFYDNGGYEMAERDIQEKKPEEINDLLGDYINDK